MNEVTPILSSIEQGVLSAAGRLLPLVYDELRSLAAQRLAKEQPGQTMQATALVHEAYVRLVNADQVKDRDSTPPGGSPAQSLPMNLSYSDNLPIAVLLILAAS
jgi:hypothetical protein